MDVAVNDQFASVLGGGRGTGESNTESGATPADAFLVDADALPARLEALNLSPDGAPLVSRPAAPYQAAHAVCQRLADLDGLLIGPYGMAVRVLPITELEYARQLVTVTVGPKSQMLPLPGQSPGSELGPFPLAGVAPAGAVSNPIPLATLTNVGDAILCGQGDPEAHRAACGVPAFETLLCNVAAIATQLLPAARAVARTEEN